MNRLVRKAAESGAPVPDGIVVEEPSVSHGFGEANDGLEAINKATAEALNVLNVEAFEKTPIAGRLASYPTNATVLVCQDVGCEFPSVDWIDLFRRTGAIAAHMMLP